MYLLISEYSKSYLNIFSTDEPHYQFLFKYAFCFFHVCSIENGIFDKHKHDLPKRYYRCLLGMNAVCTYASVISVDSP